jgi:hypothetical protein
MHSDDEGEWLPFGQEYGPGHDVWHHEGAYLPSRPERLRRWGMVGGIVFVGLAIAVGGGAFGADAYATHAICAAVGRTEPTRTPDGAAKNSAVALDQARRTLEDTAALLFFHPALRDATRGLSHDLADMRLLQDAGDPAAAAPEVSGRLLVVAMSVDNHARQAQTACGLPAEGVLNAAGAPKAPSVAAPPVDAAPVATATVDAAPPAARRATPSLPRHTATAGELWTAEQTVAVTAGKERQATSPIERQVTSYEHAAALQHLADLKAGHPDRPHHALDIRGAEARLAAAEEAYRRAMTDPAATPMDRSQARAVVEQWDEALTRLRD